MLDCCSLETRVDSLFRLKRLGLANLNKYTFQAENDTIFLYILGTHNHSDITVSTSPPYIYKKTDRFSC
jgi:hypothetical protein